jgi:hypothetical protein
VNDPHVERLHYAIHTDSSVSFDNPPALEWSKSEFILRLSTGTAVAQMVRHYAHEDDARAVVEPALRAYEISEAIQNGGKDYLQFRFERAEVVDQNPPSSGSSRILLTGVGAMVMVGEAVTPHLTRRAYPAPPVRFVSSADVETMWLRLRRYQQGGEPLASMAYFCLTVIEASVGPPEKGRRLRASQQYQIDIDVLNKLGDLSSDVGDAESARKWLVTKKRGYTDAESVWLPATILKMIHRLGEYAADPNMPLIPIAMSDLPQL